MNLDLSPRIKLGLAAAAIALAAGGAGYGIATFSRDQAAVPGADAGRKILYWYDPMVRSEEHTSELQSLMRISYAVFCLKKKKTQTQTEFNPVKVTIQNTHKTINNKTKKRHL